MRAAALCLIALLAAAAPAMAETRIAFSAMAPPDVATGVAKSERIQGYLTRPTGAGPFPAVILLHSCLGLPPDRRAIGARLAQKGYVALFVDDFTTRGLAETCEVDFAPGAADALGALHALGEMPEVDPRRIAVVGFSQGASTALELASSKFAATFAARGAPRFRAAAGFYAPCANLDGATLDIPTLIVVGARDDVTPAADCEGLKARLVVLSGAHHAFDDPDFVRGKSVHGMWLQYDHAATAKANAELDAFLAEQLKP